MTARETIKLKLLISARRSAPSTREKFNRNSLADFDCMTGDLERELDRIEEVRGGIRRLQGEVWNEYRREAALDESMAKYAARVKSN